MKKIVLSFIFISTCFLQALFSTDFTVTNTDDSGTESLRDTISSAATGDRIVFDSSLNGQSIIFISEISIDKNITIEGNVSNPIVLDGNNSTRFFNLTNGGVLTIKNLTLQNGNDASSGGAIYINASGAKLYTNNVLFKANSASFGGAIHSPSGTVYIDNTHFEENNATGTNGVGAIYSDGTVKINNSSFINNGASHTSGGYAGAISSVTTEFINSTCSGSINNSTSNPGCLLARGATKIENSTIVNNSATGNGGGIQLSGAVTLQIKNSVFYGNTATTGSQIYNPSGTITSYGYNFISDTAGASITASSGDSFDLNATNVGLGTLTKDPNGITYAYTLEPNSSLIDAGSCSDINSSTITIDQFGNNRPQGSTCDIGAIEYGAISNPNSVDIYLSNYNSSDRNISSIRYIGANGNTQNYEINGSDSLINGDNNLTLDSVIPNTEFTIFVSQDDNRSYWYNFSDNKFYGDLNISNSGFFKNTNDINGSFSIDLNSSNFVEVQGDPDSYSELIDKFSENINDQNSSIHMDPHSDVGKAYYENNVSGNIMHFNPANLFWFEHRSDSNDSNTTRLNIVELNLFNPSDSNGTWTFSEKRYEDGNTTTEDENGTFTKDGSHIYTLKESNASQADMELKFGETLDHTQLNSLISTKFTDINFTSSDQGMIVYIKQLIDEVESHDEKLKKYDSNGSFIGYFTSFSDFISTYSNGSSWFSCVESDNNCSKGIGFPSGTNSSDINGTLSLYSNENNSSSVLLSYAGTWKIENNILYLDPIVDTRDDNRVYELKGGYLYTGELNKAGDVNSDIWFNNSALDKLRPYFGAEYNTLTSSDINWSTNNTPISSSNPINYPVTNEESQFIASSISTIITDPDGDILTFSISGTDASLFTIDNNSSVLNSVSSSGFDYENPIDNNGDNTYELNVTASDGDKAITVAVNVGISNIAENNPIIITTSNLDQNVSSIELVGNETITLTSSDDINWSGTISDESNYDNNYSLQITTSDSNTWYYNSCDNRLYSENNGSSCFSSIDINASTLNTLSFDLNSSNWNISKILLESHGGVVQLKGANNYIESSNITVATDFTLEAWINPSNDTEKFEIISKNTSSNPTNNDTTEFVLHRVQTAKTLRLIMADGSGFSLVESSGTIPNNQWTHVSATYEDSTKTLTLYINGVQDGSTVLSGTRLSSSQPLQLGRHENSAESWGNGLLDEVRVWNSVRTSSDINSTMNTQLDGNETGLVTYYNFDERVGNTVKDISSSGNDAVINGDVQRLNFLGNGLEFKSSDGIDGINLGDIYNAPAVFTYSSWIRLSDDYDGQYANIIRKNGVDSLQVYQSKLQVSINKSTDGSNGTLCVSTTTLQKNKWYYVTGIYSDTDNKLEVYIDGELDKTCTESFSAGTDSTNRVIGNNSAIGATSPQFEGNIAEVSMWNKVLTQNEVKNIMASSLNGNENGLVGYWPLYEGSGTTAYDKTANNYDGNITGATWAKTSPSIYGDTMYVSEGISSKFRLSLKNNTSSSQTFSYNGTSPSEVLSFSSTGNIIYKSLVEQNTSLSVQAVDGNTTIYKTLNVRVVDNPDYKLINLSVTNVNLNENNITALTLIGQNGLDDVDVNISGVTNGDNNFSIETGEGNYSINITLDDNSTWWYNSSSHTITKTSDSSSDYLIDTNVYSSLYANLSDSNWQNDAPIISDNVTYSQSVILGTGTATNLISDVSNASSSTGINQSWDLDYDDMTGSLYVAQYSSSNVFVLKSNGDLNVTSIGDATTAYISRGYEIGYALDRRGLIYEIDIHDMNKTLILDIRSGSTTATGDLVSGSEDFYSLVYDEGINAFYMGSEDTGYIYKITKDSNVSARITGTGTKCTDYSTCPDGNASTTALGDIYGLAVHPSTYELYFVEHSINVVRKLSNAGEIITVAGNGTAATSGDGGSATSASLNKPFGIVFDNSGNLYISESAGNVIRKVDTSGNISTVISSGLNFPRGIDIDNFGNIYAINWTNPQILKYTKDSNFSIEISENNSSVFINSSIYTSDAENDNLTYSISGPDASFFDINSSTGEIQFITAPDYENATDYNDDNKYEFNLIVSDGTNNTTQFVIVTVTDVQDSSNLVINPPFHNFGKATVNGNETISFQIINTGSSTISSLNFSLSDTNNFSMINNCNTELNSTKSCFVNITAKPQSAISYSETLTITSSDYGSPHSVELNATGVNLDVGDLDPSFGNDGIVIDNLNFNQAINVNDILTFDDGSFILVGSGRNGSVTSGLMIKYNSSGLLDGSFANGKLEENQKAFNAAYLDKNGSIIVAGADTNSSKILVSKYLNDGTLDTSFGTAGHVNFSEGDDDSSAIDMAVLSDDRIVIANKAYYDDDGNEVYYLRLLAYDENGTRDTSFGSDDNVTFKLDINDSNVSVEPVSLVVDNSDNIYVGSNFTDTNGDILILKYTSNGEFDNSFGNNGKVFIDINSSTEYMTDMVLQNDGKILISGYYQGTISQYDHLLIRLESNGALDSSFGDGGYKIVDINSSGNPDKANTLKVQNDGKILLAGYDEEVTSDYRMTLLRFDSNGTIDSTFGSNGLTIAEVNSFDQSRAEVIAMPTSDSILLAGGDLFSGSFAVSKIYNNDINSSMSNSSQELNITITNYNTSTHNISNILYVGANGNSVYEDINGSDSLNNGDNNLSISVNDTNTDFSLQIVIDSNTTYWYNFDDGNLYSEHNLSSSFIKNLSDLTGSLTIDLNTATIISSTLPNSYNKILSEFSSNIHNLDSNGEIEMEVRSDVDRDYYENNISSIIMPYNPANMLRFEHRKDGNDSNTTEFRYSFVKFSSTTDSNGTFEYSEFKLEDNNESNESETGTFTKDVNNTIRIKELNVSGDSEEIKFGELLDSTDLSNLISGEFTDINFTSDDKGIIVYMKNLTYEIEIEDRKVEKRDSNDSNNTVIGYFTSFSEFISHHVNNNSTFSCLSKDNNCSQGIAFSSNIDSNDTNGTLVVRGHDENGSKVILANAGTWKIQSNIFYIYPTVSMENQNLIKLENGYLYYAREDKIGEVEADIWLNPSAARKLVQYFGGVYNNYTGYSKDWTYTIDYEPNFDNNLSDLVVSEDSTSFDINISASDVDGDTINYSVALSNNSLVSHSLNSNILTITPLANASGIVSVEVNASSTSFTTTQNFNITINPVNDGPIANNDDVNTSEDANITINVLGNDTDTELDILSIVGINIAPNNGNAIIVGSSINYTPNQDFTGNDTFSYTISDGNLNASASVSVLVIAVNDAPIANNDSVTISEDTNITINVLDNDSDVDSNLSIISIDTNSTQGNVSFSDKNITYIAKANFTGNDSFTYTISDGNLSAIATVNVTVSNQNDAPSITSASSVNVNENTTAVITITANDTDGDILTYSINGGADEAKFDINSSSGVLSFKSAPDYENPEDGNTNNVYRVRIVVSDGSLEGEQNLSVAVKDVAESSEIYINFNEHNSSEYNISNITAIGQDGLDQNISFTSSNDINWSSIVSIDGNYTIRIDTTDENSTKYWWFDFNDSKIYHELNGSSFVTTLHTNNSIIYDINSSSAWENRIPSVSDVNISINENNGTVFIDLDDYVSDYENDTIKYNGYNGVDTDDLTLFVGGAIKFKNAPDYENPSDNDQNNVYHITVYADDGKNNISIPVTVNVLNIIDDNNITISITSSDRNISSLNLIGDQNISLVNSNDTNWTGVINEANFANNYTLQITTDDSKFWYYNSCDNKLYDKNDGSSCFSNIEISANTLNSLSYDLNYLVEIINGSWEQTIYNSKYQNNSIVDNNTYATLTVNKITNDKSILELSQSSLGTLSEASADINLSSIDNNTYVSLILSDDNNYSTKLTITSQKAIAYVYNGATLESNSTIFTQDTSNYFLQKRVKLNTWFLDNKIYFNITDEKNNQLGKVIQVSNGNMTSFSKHTLEIVLESSASNSVSVDFYGITSNENISYAYYKRLSHLEFSIDEATYTSAGQNDINGTNLYQIQTDTNGSGYIYTRVGKINPINSYALEESVSINYKNVITNIDKQKNDLNISNNIIRMDDNNDSVFDEEIKYIGTVDLSTINSKLSSAGFNTSLSGSAGGYKLYSKQLTSMCKVNYTDTSNTYVDSSTFIVDYTEGTNNYLMSNRFNNLKALQFRSGNELVEKDLNSSSSDPFTKVGTYTQISENCIDSNGNTIQVTLFDMNLTVDGYDSTIGLYNPNNESSTNYKVYTEYKKANDTKEIYFFNEEAAKQLTLDLGITKTPTKTVNLDTTTWNYVSLSSNITLCISEFQSALPSICNQDYTIEEVFSEVDSVLKYTGYWSYWENNTSSYNVDKLSTINNKEGILINTSTASIINMPYNLFDTIETDVMDLYQTGWFLTSVPMDHTTSHVEEMVSSQGKTLKYILYLDNSNSNNSQWNVYAPRDDNLVDANLTRLNTIKADESFWLYVE